MSKAFTLIELLVVVSIIVLITALTLPNYRSGDSQLAIQRSAHKIAQDLRRAQEFAISVKEFNGNVPDGYGIYFNLGQPDRYIMFADLNNDQAYSGTTEEKAEEVILEGNVVLKSFAPSTTAPTMTVFFAPPGPSIQFFPDTTTTAINIKVLGVTVSVTSYYYKYDRSFYGLLTPRANLAYGVSANCDISDRIADCPANFSALAGEPLIVYDQTAAGTRSESSNIYNKKSTQSSIPLTQTIQVNKAGLIFIE